MSSATPTLADLEALAAEEPFVRSLARGLVFEATQVDDVVQQTWLECLKRKVPDGEHRRAWLARVVRSRAANLRRSESRRRAREESAARPEAGLGTDVLVERAEQRRQVVEAVLELPPIYRQVLLLRYFENLPPRKIAAEIGVPANTVSTRIKRALDLLRERFDQENGGDRRSWQLALVPLALPSGRLAAMGAAASSSWTAWTSTAALPWFVVFAIGLSVATWWIASGEDQAPVVSDPTTVTATTAGASTSPDAAGTTGATTGADEGGGRVELATAGTTATVAAADGLAVVTGRLLDPDGTPAVGRSCRLWSFDPMVGFGSTFEPFGAPSDDAGPSWVDAVTDEHGVFRFDAVPPDGLAALWLDHDGPHTTWHVIGETPPRGDRLDVGTVQLEQRGGARGTVVGRDGQPIAGAEVWAADVPGAVLQVAPVDRLDPDGALFIALPAVATADAQSYHERLNRHLRAWVLQAEDEAGFQVLPMAPWATRMLAELPVQRATTDAAGQFELGGLAPGGHVLVVKAPGRANGGKPRIAVRAGQVRDVGRIRLDDAEPFTARVLDVDGAPVAGAEVRVALRPRIGLTGILFGSAPCVTAADGTAAVDTLPRGDVVVAYRRGPHAPWSTSGPYGTDEAVDLTLPPTSRIQLAVKAGADQTPESFRFRVWQGPPFGELTAAGLQPAPSLRNRLDYVGVRDERHVWTLDDLAPGLWTLAVSADGHATELRLVELGAGDNDPLSIDLRGGGSLHVAVTDGAGGAVEGAQVFVEADADRDVGWDGSLLFAYGGVGPWDRVVRGGVRTGADGTVVLRDLPAGGGSVLVRHSARGVASRRYDDLADGARFELQAPGAIEGRLTLRGAAPPPGMFRLTATPLGSTAGTSAPDISRVAVPAEDGTFRSDGLTPGRWKIIVETVDEDDASFDSFGGLIEAMRPSLDWGFGDPRSETVEVPVGGTVEVAWDADATVAAPDGEAATVTGRVMIDGVPAAGWSLRASMRTDSWTRFDTEFAVTAADGSFVRHDVAPQSIELILQDPQNPTAVVWQKEIDASNGPVELSIDIARAELAVRALDPLDRPAADHQVTVYGTHPDGATFHGWAITGPSGRCTVGVYRGSGFVQVTGRTGSARLTDVPLDGRTSRDVRLSTAGLFSGRVLPGPDLEVTMIGVQADDESWTAFHSTEDGSFVFTELDPGRYRITLHTSDGRREGVPREIELGPDGLVDQVVRVGPPAVD